MMVYCGYNDGLYKLIPVVKTQAGILSYTGMLIRTDIKWPRGLRRRSAAERLLGSRVRIPPRAWMFVCCECLCCQVEVSETGRSLVQRSPTDRGVCLSVLK
jgi:hypothetical protein